MILKGLKNIETIYKEEQVLLFKILGTNDDFNLLAVQE